MMNKLIVSLAVILNVFSLKSFSQCDADHLVILNNFEFVPSDLTIAPGETVAFINIEGEHTLNGITNSITGEPFNNPFEIFLDQTTGTVDGACMGIVDFDTAGVFNFDCSVGYNAQAGMTLTINVDAFDLNDLMIDLYSNQELPIFLSQYAFSAFTNSYLTQSGPWTVFVPNNDAVSEILEYMNLNQFDALSIPDFTEILEYHIADGVWLAEDLYNGLQLPTAQGQSLNISQNNQGTFVNGAQILSTNFEAYNGVVHIIDYCLAPQGLPEATVMEIIRQSDGHQILEQAIEAVGLDDDLSVQASIDNSINGPGPWTVFAPTDDAFAVFAEELGIASEDILNSQFLANIVNNHIVNNEILAEEMYSGNVATTLQNEQIEFEYVDSVIYVIGEQNTVEITIQNLYAYNGVVHVVDAVLSPFIPTIEGTCGVWRLLLQSNSNEGWGQNELYLYRNDEFVEVLSVFEGGADRIYDFGVDVGDDIDLYYVPNGGGSISQSYKLFNSEEEMVVYATVSAPDYMPLASYTDIIACQTFEEDHCGILEIETTNIAGYGWYGTLNVYKNGVFEKAIGMPIGYRQIAFMNSNYNDTFNFVVNNPVWPEETGYSIYDTDGQLAYEEEEANVAPQNSPELLFCEQANEESWNCIGNACIDPLDGTGNYSTLVDCEQVCQSTSSVGEEWVGVKIYPNPSSSVFYLEFYTIDETEISVTNLLGAQLYIDVVKPHEESNTQIDLSNFSKGVYTLSLKTSDKTSVHKLILK